jgi:hypothetical protein
VTIRDGRIAQATPDDAAHLAGSPEASVVPSGAAGIS